MSIGIATHIKSGTQVEFMHYAEGNYKRTIEWYERDSGRKVIDSQHEPEYGEYFSYYTLQCEREIINDNWYLIRWGQNDYTAVCPRDFKEWFEVIKG